MRPADLHHRELFEVETTPGIVRFAGQRALILDAVALGLLRKELLDTVGLEAGRGILSRFGYAHLRHALGHIRRPAIGLPDGPR